MALFEYPIVDTYDHLVVTSDDQVIAYYKIPSMTVTVVDGKKKTKIKEDVGRTLKKLLPNQYFEIALVPKDFRLIEKMQDMTKVLSPDAYELGKLVLNTTINDLNQEIEIPYEYEWIIGIWLDKKEITLDVAELMMNQINKASRLAMERLGYEVERESDWYKNWQAEEISAYGAISALHPKRLTNEEMFYHQRYQYLRYTRHEKDDVCASRHLLNVTDTQIYPSRQGHLKLVTPYGESYMSILPVGKSPVMLNGQHIAETVAKFNFPVEMRIKASFTEINGVNGIAQKMGRSRQRTRNIMREATNTGSKQQDRIIEGKFSLDDLDKKIGDKKRQEPIVDYEMYIIVCASSIQSLKARKKVVLSTFGSVDIDLSRANFDQPYLFAQTLLGKKLDPHVAKWKHTATSAGLAEQMLFTKTFAGTHSGFYLGRIDHHHKKHDDIFTAIRASQNLVFFNPTIANKEGIDGKDTKNPHIRITGETGGGKTATALNLMMQASLTKTKLLYIDPKSAIRKWFMRCCQDTQFEKKYPELVRHLLTFNYVTLDHKDKANHGVLDPIVNCGGTEAVDVMKSIIDYMGNDQWQMKQKTAISKAIKQTVAKRQKGELVGTQHVIALLQESNDALIREAGDYLFEMFDGSILSLIASDGTVKGLSYDERVTILEVAGLSLPNQKDIVRGQKLKGHERDSVAVMLALGNFCRQFGSKDENEETIEFIDESWIFEQSAEGMMVLKSMKRVGRSQNNMLVLITQSVNDGDASDDTTGFGTVFAFDELNEREDILKYMDIEVTERNKEWLANMKAGQCILRDVYGNVNLISIHIHMPGWLELFSPLQATLASKAEQKYAS